MSKLKGEYNFVNMHPNEVIEVLQNCVNKAIEENPNCDLKMKTLNIKFGFVDINNDTLHGIKDMKFQKKLDKITE